MARPSVETDTGSSRLYSMVRNIKWEYLVAGISGGVVSTLVLHPLDLVKIRFQGKYFFKLNKTSKISRHINVPLLPEYREFGKDCIITRRTLQSILYRAPIGHKESDIVYFFFRSLPCTLHFLKLTQLFHRTSVRPCWLVDRALRT